MSILIIGGGLSGILVSALLFQKGISHSVVETGASFTGTRASSGILNPVMGRKRQLVAHHEVLFPKCKESYSYLESLLNANLFYPVRILEALSGEANLSFFREKALQYPDFLSIDTFPESLKDAFYTKPESLFGVTQNAYRLDTTALQKRYHVFLKEKKALLEKTFHLSEAQDLKECFSLDNQLYTHIIFCNGRYFPEIPATAPLPLSVNKGQALLIALADDLPRNLIFKFGKGLTLCPHGENHWWAGASFEWQFDNENPTADFATDLIHRLCQHLKSDFRVVEALAGCRVSAPDRTAVAGWLPHDSRIGFLNAMGTKGVLQAPQAATELVENLISGGAAPGLFNALSYNAF